MPDLSTGLTDRIRRLCNEHGDTLASLERKLEFGNGTIRRWSKTSPSGDKLRKVADYFGISLDYLLGRVASDGISVKLAKDLYALETKMYDPEIDHEFIRLEQRLFDAYLSGSYLREDKP